MAPGTQVTTQRGERGVLLRTYQGEHWAYALVQVHGGPLVDTPLASLLPATPTLIDRLRWWLRWDRFSWKPAR